MKIKLDKGCLFFLLDGMCLCSFLKHIWERHISHAWPSCAFCHFPNVCPKTTQASASQAKQFAVFQQLVEYGDIKYVCIIGLT